MTVFTLTIVRHGETLANKKQILQGQQDTALSDVGLRQAQLVAQRLQYEQFTHMFSSDLCRASKTAHTVLACNQTEVNTTVMLDTRLRERKFASFEGKHIKVVREAAKQANKTVRDYTPPGAETVEQLRHRAVLFFQELCQVVQQDAEKDKTNTKPVKRRRGNDDRLSCSPNDIFKMDKDFENSEDMGSWNVKRTDHSNSGSTSGCSSLDSTESQSTSETSIETVVAEDDVVETYTPASIFKSYETDIMGISGSRDIAHGCPNVSLSPLLQHRLSSISSISSGRNNSFDDMDAFPMIVADVLIVSHGGLIRELFRHFIEDLDCQIPGGKGFAMRTTPNTGISKFAISLEDDKVQVTCILIHDKDHLVEDDNPNPEGLL